MTCKSGHSIFKKSCQDCKELQSKWYKKAKGNKKADGSYDWEDIEDENENLTDHKSILDLYNLKDFKTTDVFEAKVEYNIWAEQILQKAKFISSKDKKIWKYHVKGLSRRKIAPKVGLEGSWVSRKIKKIQKYLKDQEH